MAPYSAFIFTTYNLEDLPNSEYLVEHSYGRESDGKRWLPQDLSDDDLATMRATNRAHPCTYALHYQDASDRRWFGSLANHDSHSSAEIVHLDPSTALSPMCIRIRPSRTLHAGEALTVCYLARKTQASNNFTFDGIPGETRYNSQPIHQAYGFPYPDQPSCVQPTLPPNFSMHCFGAGSAKPPKDTAPGACLKPSPPSAAPTSQRQPNDEDAPPTLSERFTSLPKPPMEPRPRSPKPGRAKTPSAEGLSAAHDHSSAPISRPDQASPHPRQPCDDTKSKPQQGPYWTRATHSSKPAPRPQPKGPSGPTPGNFFTPR